MEWTGARYADTPAVAVEIWVSAPPDRVWPAVSDVRAMAAMSDEVQSVEWLDGAPGPAVGARFLATNKHPAFGTWSTTSYVVECVQPSVFAWAVGDPDNPSTTWRFTLEPVDGGTGLRQWAQIGPARSGLSFAIDRMPEKEQKIVFVRLREIEASMTRTLAAIKEKVESAQKAETAR